MLFFITFNSILGRPFSLQNCTITNQTSDTFNVDCIEGFDGGLPQTFQLELVEVPSLRLVRNLSIAVSGTTVLVINKNN